MMTRVARSWGLLLALAIVPLVGMAQSATTNPEDEYKKLVKVDTEIQPLGETPFGESVNPFDGSLSFHVVDVSIPGNGPTIELGRTFHADGDAEVRWNDAAFGDWELDIPRLTTMTSNASTIVQGPNQIGWLVNSVARTDRCSTFTGPPDQRVGGPDSEPVASDDWWNEGYMLYTPGGGTEDMLARRDTSPVAPQDGTNYVAVSKNLWHLGCLASTANGEPGEAFLAKGPNGERVWLNQLVYRPARGYTIQRRLGEMMATRVEDRFGNSLTYTYDGARLTRIDGSDGRQVTLDYTADGLHVAHINVVTANGTRTWAYGYTAVTGGSVLSSVSLPDGSAWNYSLADLAFDVKSTPSLGHCLDPIIPDESLLKVGSITGPSGISGRFEMRPTRHGRSDVLELCNANSANSNGTESVPRYSNNLALRGKSFTGAGIGSLAWSYTYPLATGSWRKECQASGCGMTSYSEMVDPAGNTTRFTFSNRADATEGKALKTEYFSGAAVNAPVRTETLAYADPAQGPWPSSYGYGFNVFANRDRQQSEVPLSRKDISQDGDTYTWQAMAFDAYARPSSIRRSNSFGYSVDEAHTYLDDPSKSIIGLPAQSVNLTTGEAVTQTDYDVTTLTPTARYRFGSKVMDYAFNAQGQLSSFTDGNGKTTTLGSYTRGIPTIIGYPDGTTQSVAVDDFGQIASITDQAGSTTGYGYDAIGRIVRIDYPSGDSTPWAPKIYTYAYSADARGMGGDHWVRTVVQGNLSQRTDFDAMLRPVVSNKADANTAALAVSSRTEYDWAGRKIFQSYPVDGTPDRASIALGVATAYDALGRPVTTTQSSEQDNLISTTAYVAGGGRAVTDPQGHVTTSHFQVFDEPGFDSVVEIEAPEGVTQVVSRDTYGNVLSLSQGGLTRTMTYDGQHRLCRSWEPETGSTIAAYDAADNVIWSAAGQPFNGEGCGYDQVADAAKTASSYDAMDRVTSVTYPNGSLATSFTYDPLGKPATAVAATSAASANSTGTVGWAYGRNKLGLLTAEVLSVDGWSWTLGYGYDANGNLASVQYPDNTTVATNPNVLGQPTAAGNYANSATYFPDGDLASYALGNGALFSATKNVRNLLTNFSFGTGTNIAVSEDFAYDKVGNVLTIKDQAGSEQRTRAMTYDGLSRLVSATASNLWGSESYTYDTLNNIRSLTDDTGTHTYTYDANNRLASISNNGSTVHSFNYDAQGNTTTKDSQVMTFDLANRLLSVNGKGDYLYDASGHRVKAVTPAGTTYYAYSSAGQLMWEYDGGNTNATSYVYLGKKLVASRKASTSVVLGSIGQVTSGANAAVPGWACSSGVAAPIVVHLYVGGPAGTGTAIGAWTADQASEQAVQDACHSSGTSHRFTIPLTEAVRAQYAGQSIYIHGISPTGGDNSLLDGSGVFVVPPSTLAPVAPASVGASAASDLSNISVNWSATGNTTSYTVEQSFNVGAWSTIYTGAATSASVTAPADGSYQFRVSSCNANGCSAPTTSASVSVAHIPPIPSSISAPASSTGAVGLSWAGSIYATAYGLEHSADGVNWVQVYAGAGTSATISEGTGSWTYRVQACNANGCSGYATSAAVAVTVPPAAAPSIAGGGASSTGAYTISWSGVAGATSYNLMESANGGALTTVQNDGNGSWSTSGKGNGGYIYQVQACNAGGCGPFSGQVGVTVALVPSIPSDYRMDDTVTGRREMITISWSASAGATRYELLRVQTNNIINAGAALSNVVESGASPYEMKYTYRLRACNDQGCSEWSREIAG